MTPEQQKIIEQWYEKWKSDTKRNGGVLIGSSIRECLTDFAEYAMTNLSPGGWVRASEYKGELSKKYCGRFIINGNISSYSTFYWYDDEFRYSKYCPVLKEDYEYLEIFDETLSPSDKDKEIERLMGIINHVHNLAADDIPDGVGPCEDAARKIIDIDAYLTEALNTKEV